MSSTSNNDTSKIRMEAKALLAEGISRQETYEILKEKFGFAITVAKVVKKLPTQNSMKKYVFFQWILVLFLAYSAYLESLPNGSYMPFIWYGAFIYMVLAQRIKSYFLISAWATLRFLAHAFFTARGYGLIFPEHLLQITVLIYVPSIFLPIWLERKMCSDPIEEKEVYVNQEGQKRMRINYRFKD